MKTRTKLVFLLVGVVFLSLGTWKYFSMSESLELMDLMQFAVILLLVGFALILAMQRLRSEKRGEPAEDEFSKKIMQKAASTAYYFSLYWWLALVFISDSWKLETESLIGTGILGMAILFAFSWLYFKLKGIKS